MKSRNLSHIKEALYLFLTSVLLCLPAFHNGYPWVFSDTGTYIESAFTLLPPQDRPIGYSLFIDIFSVRYTLWTVILAQAFFLNYALYRTIRIFNQKEDSKQSTQNTSLFIHSLVVLFLTFFTSASWFVSQVMPDIFVALTLLIIFIFIRQKPLSSPNKTEKIFLSALLFIATITHTANFIIAIIVLLFLSIYFFWSDRTNFMYHLKKICVLGGVVLSGTIFLATYNYHYYKVFVFNPSSSLFLIARIGETTIMKDFLETTCPKKNYMLCQYKDQFPMGVESYLWDPKSPLNQIGWKTSAIENAQIIPAIFSKPSYMIIFLQDSIEKSAQLLFSMELDSFGSYQKNSPIYDKIQRHFPNEENQFITTKQFENKLEYKNFASSIFVFIVGLSTTIILYFFIKKSFLKEEKIFLLLILFGVCSNTIIMGTLSGSFDRYNSRIIWLIPFIAFTKVAQNLSEHHSRKNPHKNPQFKAVQRTKEKA